MKLSQALKQSVKSKDIVAKQKDTQKMINSLNKAISVTKQQTLMRRASTIVYEKDAKHL